MNNNFSHCRPGRLITAVLLLLGMGLLSAVVACTPTPEIVTGPQATPTLLFLPNVTDTPLPPITLEPIIRSTVPPTDWEGLAQEEANAVSAAATATAAATPQPVTVRVDTAADGRPISPHIYGVSGASADYLEALQPGLNSWGGNPNTRYNWRLGNAWNTAADANYRNTSYDYEGDDAAADFVIDTREVNAAVRMALPTLGWVAKNNDPDTCSFPLPGGQCGTGNGSTCQSPEITADPTTTSVRSTPADIAAFVQHLADLNLLPIYLAMDNEPELWGITHYDVHPECTTYAEILQQYVDYATAVRDPAPEAQLMGPVTCCWWYYWNSAAGQEDKARYDNQDFLPWFLERMREHDEAAGRRHLDVLDIHYYPEGLYNDAADEVTAAHRLRATKSLYDENYADESWIREPIRLIPRMKELIDTHYPGTRFAVSEWNFGADETMNGALAIADVLGIYGREGVDMAAYWRHPPLNSAGYYAFKMYTNPAEGVRFGNLSLPTETTNVDQISAYAARDGETGRLHLILVNKVNALNDTVVNIDLDGFQPAATATVYRYTGPDYLDRDEGITLATLSAEAQMTLAMDNYSLLHIVFTPAD